MNEEPRDNPPEDEQAEEEGYEDEISLDELEGNQSDFLTSSQDKDEEEQPQASEQPDRDAGYDDEVTFDELDEEAAGFFEVYATPAPPSPPEDTPPDEQDLFEVEATRSEQPPSQPSPPAPASRSAGTASAEQDNIRRLHNVEVEVIATLGTTRMQIRDILGLQVGSVVELHRMVGEPVDVTLNGRLIARGEVVVVDEKFAIRVHEIAGNDE